MRDSNRVKIISRLRELGFSEYEALAYAALLELSEGTADDISRKAGIPLPRVYSVLEELERKGFVEILGGRPKRYSLKDPRIAIDEYLKAKKRELEESFNRLKKLWLDFRAFIEQYYIAPRLRIKPEELIIPLPTLEEAEKRTREIIQNARREILIMSRTFAWMDRVKDVLNDAIGRGVAIKVLMRVDEITRDKVNELKVMGVKVHAHPLEWYPVRGTIVDRSKAVFVIWAEPPRGNVGYIYKPHYTENPGLIKLLTDVFYMYWRSCKD